MNTIGVYGVGVMGRGLALNMASRGHRVAIYNKEPTRMIDVVRDARQENIHAIEGFHTVQEFLTSLERPRKVLVMVPAGQPVCDVLTSMCPYIEPGDIIVDGGNELYRNTQERQALMSVQHKAHLVGMGVSGGAYGARYGAAFMPGGDRDAVDAIIPFLRDASDSQSRVSYVGKGGSGHFVKTVHNGIEYAIMQAIAEVYDILRTLYDMTHEDIAAFFERCDEKYSLNSYLLQITCDILRKKDDMCDSGDNSSSGSEIRSWLLDKVKDVPRMNGTGAWTAKESFECLVPCPTITAAIDARIIASAKDIRTHLGQYRVSTSFTNDEGDPASLPCSMRFIANALAFTMCLAYLQGFQLITKKSEKENWGVDVHALARIWMGGCIIRSGTLEWFADETLHPDVHLNNMLASHLEDIHDIASVVAMCVTHGIHTPVLSATYQYILGYTSTKSPANLIQAQRDYFGSHGYERIDRPGKFTTTSWKPTE